MQLFKRQNRLFAFILSAILVFQLTACANLGESLKQSTDSVIDSAKSAASSIGEGVSKAKERVSDWYRSIDLSKFKSGWDTAAAFLGTAYASALSSEYVTNVGNAINSLKQSINAAEGSIRGIAQEAGFVAEKWIAGTFNIDAAARESSHYATVPNSNELGSPDVVTDYGELVSSKYYSSPKGSARAQARTTNQAKELIQEYAEYYHSETSQGNAAKSLKDYMDAKGYDPEHQDSLLKSIYDGQTRIIPKDQIVNAHDFLQGRIDTLAPIGNDISNVNTEIYQETLANLRDRLSAPDGTESKPLTYEEAQAIAELAEAGVFDPEDFGISISSVISPKYVLKQAVGTGLESGLLRTVFEVGPDLVSIIIEAVKTSSMDQEALGEVGIEGAIAFSEGFVEGAIGRVVVTLCDEGVLGTAFKNAPSEAVGALVFLVIESMIAGYSLAKGTISAEEYGWLMADKTMITALAIPTTALFLAFLPGTKLFMLIGCLAGGLIASTGYTIAKEAFLEFVDGGGFEAILPAGIETSISSARESIAQLHITEFASKLKDYVVTTAESGIIKIQSAIGQ